MCVSCFGIVYSGNGGCLHLLVTGRASAYFTSCRKTAWKGKGAITFQGTLAILVRVIKNNHADKDTNQIYLLDAFLLGLACFICV